MSKICHVSISGLSELIILNMSYVALCTGIISPSWKSVNLTRSWLIMFVRLIRYVTLWPCWHLTFWPWTRHGHGLGWPMGWVGLWKMDTRPCLPWTFVVLHMLSVYRLSACHVIQLCAKFHQNWIIFGRVIQHFKFGFPPPLQTFWCQLAKFHEPSAARKSVLPADTCVIKWLVKDLCHRAPR